MLLLVFYWFDHCLTTNPEGWRHGAVSFCCCFSGKLWILKFTGGKSLVNPNIISKFEIITLILYLIFDGLVLGFYLVFEVKRHSFRILKSCRFQPYQGVWYLEHCSGRHCHLPIGKIQAMTWWLEVFQWSVAGTEKCLRRLSTRRA